MAAPSEPAFLRWMREIYRPEAEKFGTDIKLLKIPETEPGTVTYALQFCINAGDEADIWVSSRLYELTDIASKAPYSLGNEQLVHFSTVMEIIR